MTCNPFHEQKPPFQTLHIFGAGGAGREIAWLAEQCWPEFVVVAFVVDMPDHPMQPVNGHRIRQLVDVKPEGSAAFVVAVGDPLARRRIAARCHAIPLNAATLVHPRAELSTSVVLGEGSIVCAGSVLTTNIRVGRHAYFNVQCSVSHDAVLGDFVTLSPRVTICGHVRVGHDVFIGAGATIINGSPERPLVIGDRARIAAGACVTQSVAADARVAGVPAVQK